MSVSSIRRGSSVKIYKTRVWDKMALRYRTAFEVRYEFGGVTHRKVRAKRQAAIDVATLADRAISQGNAGLFEMSPADAYEWKYIKGVAARFSLTPRQMADRYAIILEKTSAPDSPKVADALASFLAAKKQKGLSAEHLRGLRVLLTPFARQFHMPIREILPDMVRAYLDALKVSARSRNNALGALTNFFRHYELPDAIKGIDPLPISRKAPNIYDPETLRKLLDACGPRGNGPALARCIALSAFAHLRSEEVWRLGRVGSWHIDWKHNRICLGEDIAKGREGHKRPRQIKMSDNLRAWLADIRGETGPVCPYVDSDGLGKAKMRLAAGAGIKWKRNVLRKSSVSYRVAQTGDLARVSFESGHSVKILEGTYLSIGVTEEAVDAWYRIYPRGVNREFPFVKDLRRVIKPSSPNIIQLENARKTA